jgi:PAS domain S-box-containing protein
VTEKTAPSLDDLAEVNAPAWLWDGARMRIVWANRAGVAFFGCDSLFDLIDTPFDETDPGVGRVFELSKTVKRGESWQEIIGFASAISDAPFSASVHVHSLADGRSGLLVVADTALADTTGQEVSGELGSSILETLPVAALLCSDDGTILYANAAARLLMGSDAPAALSADDAKNNVSALFARTSRAGVAMATLAMSTGFGQREVRCTAKPLAGSEHFTVVLEDVTDRRALERGVAAAPSPASSAPATQEVKKITTSAPQTLARLREAIEAATETGTVVTPAQPAQLSAVSTDDAKPATAPAAKTVAKFDVPEIVRSALSGIPRAIVLHRAGKIIYANQAVASALGHDDENQLVARHDIATALGKVPGKGGVIFLADSNGGDIEFKVEKSTFPWNDGAMPMAILSPPGDKKAAVETASAEPAKAEAAKPAPDPAGTRAGINVPKSSSDNAPSKTNTPDVKLALVENQQPAVSATELVSILDTASDGIVFLTTDGDITHMSAGAEALFGVHAASVIDKPLSGLMDKPGAKVVRDYVAALGDSGLSTVFDSGREIAAKMMGGGEVPLFVTMRKLAGQMPGIPSSAYCAVLRDITQWKKTEADLREARDKAEHISRQKSDFLARISHELRTPLNAILGFSDVMRKGQFGKLGSERYEGYANDIHTSGEYLLSLVNDLLDLSKVEAGKLDLNFISVDLGQVIDACIKLMQDEATGARIVLRKSVAANLPQVVADMRSIKQILLNLLGNSIKFTDPGGQIIISAKPAANGELILSVTDTGVGMNEDQLSKALEPFQRIDIAGRSEVQGTGLGLPLTKALVEANRAEFLITSESRKGTRVDITFPTTRVLAS